MQYRTRSGVHNYILRYEYATNVSLEFLPNRIRSFLVRDGKATLLAEWEILSIKTSSDPLPRALFDPQALIARDQLPVRYFTNDSWYAVNALGRLAPIGAPGGQPTRPLESLKANNLYFDAVVLSSIAAFAFAWRQNHNHKSTTKEKLC